MQEIRVVVQSKEDYDKEKKQRDDAERERLKRIAIFLGVFMLIMFSVILILEISKNVSKHSSNTNLDGKLIAPVNNSSVKIEESYAGPENLYDGVFNDVPASDLGRLASDNNFSIEAFSNIPLDGAELRVFNITKGESEYTLRVYVEAPLSEENKVIGVHRVVLVQLLVNGKVSKEKGIPLNVLMQ